MLIKQFPTPSRGWFSGEMLSDSLRLSLRLKLSIGQFEPSYLGPFSGAFYHSF